MSLTDLGIMTPYSTVMPLVGEDMPTWTPEEEAERIASYQKYDEMYWNHPSAFKLVSRGAEEKPIYIPEPRRIVDATAHFLLKGLRIEMENGEAESPDAKFLRAFMDREVFVSRFTTAKLAGVARGDYIFHVTADPLKPPNTRVSITTVDPASYFPIFDDNDPDKRIGVDLVEQYMTNDGNVRLKRQRYKYVVIGGRRRIQSSLGIYEIQDWWKPTATLVEKVMDEKLLPEAINTIPVYAFKNIDWDGQLYGSSELRGFEKLFVAINQSVTDEEIALALEGLGVYATDAGAPEAEDGEEEGSWVIAPGMVQELPAGAYFKRVEGVGSVQPMQDHITYLTKVLHGAAATFDTAQIDVQTAESGIALAIKFLPTLAKIESRDELGLSVLTQMWWDLRQWFQAYENVKISGNIVPKLGEKLPQNRTAQLNELNNMMDRKVISRAYYRREMKKFGYDIPEDIEEEVLEEERIMAEARVFKEDVQTGNQSNNKDRPNESGGTEASNGTTSAQQRRSSKRA